MSSIKLLENSKISVIEEHKVGFENENITYRLYRIDFIEATKYAISASLRNEAEVCLTGHGLSETKALYEAISRNAVTPCTLAYVIEDYCKEIY